MNPRAQQGWCRIVGASGFTLVEVVAALGIFSVGIVVVLRLFAGISDSVRRSGEAETGIHAAETIIGQLRARSFGEVASCLLTADELQELESNAGSGVLTDPRLFFADAKADKMGQVENPIWHGREGERYFEIALIRNEGLSPPAADAEAVCLAFTARVRWPAGSRAGGQVAVLAGSVLRTR